MKVLWFILGFVMALVVVAILVVGPLSNLAASAGVPRPPESAPQPTTAPTVVAAAPTPRLSWRREGGAADSCALLDIDRANTVRYAPCEEGPRVAYLTSTDLDTLMGYVARYAPFQYAVQEGTGDLAGVTTRLSLAGQGTRPATSTEQAEVARWAAGVYERMMSDEQRADLSAEAKLKLAQRLNLAPDDIAVASFETMTWPDACLGIRETGLFCAQVLTPGYQIILRVQDKTYEYRTDLHGMMRAAPEPAAR